jgi:hypothetical protein
MIAQPGCCWLLSERLRPGMAAKQRGEDHHQSPAGHTDQPVHGSDRLVQLVAPVLRVLGRRQERSQEVRAVSQRRHTAGDRH